VNRLLAGKTFGQLTVARVRERQKDDIKMDCREAGYGDGRQVERSCGISGV
jgi:hypothetical protein